MKTANDDTFKEREKKIAELREQLENAKKNALPAEYIKTLEGEIADIENEPLY